MFITLATTNESGHVTASKPRMGLSTWVVLGLTNHQLLPVSARKVTAPGFFRVKSRLGVKPLK